MINPGDVEITPVYKTIKTAHPVYGYDAQYFNATLAAFWSVATDLIFSINFQNFLISSHVIDTTPNSANNNCTVRSGEPGGYPCEARYFLSPGIEPSITSLLQNDDFAGSDMVVAENQLGTEITFQNGDLNSTYNVTLECSAYGFDNFAFSLCFKDGDSGTIISRKWRQVYTPKEI
jgi:hypothetical protein